MSKDKKSDQSETFVAHNARLTENRAPRQATRIQRARRPGRDATLDVSQFVGKPTKQDHSTPTQSGKTSNSNHSGSSSKK